MVVNQDFVLNVPDNISLAGAAPLMCAGITVCFQQIPCTIFSLIAAMLSNHFTWLQYPHCLAPTMMLLIPLPVGDCPPHTCLMPAADGDPGVLAAAALRPGQEGHEAGRRGPRRPGPHVRPLPQPRIDSNPTDCRGLGMKPGVVGPDGLGHMCAPVKTESEQCSGSDRALPPDRWLLSNVLFACV